MDGIVKCYRLHEFRNGRWVPASKNGYSDRATAELNHGGQLLLPKRFRLMETEVPIRSTLFECD